MVAVWLAYLYRPALPILGEDRFQAERGIRGEKGLDGWGRFALPGLTPAGRRRPADHRHAEQLTWQHRMPDPLPGVDQHPRFSGMG